MLTLRSPFSYLDFGPLIRLTGINPLSRDHGFERLVTCTVHKCSTDDILNGACLPRVIPGSLHLSSPARSRYRAKAASLLGLPMEPTSNLRCLFHANTITYMHGRFISWSWQVAEFLRKPQPCLAEIEVKFLTSLCLAVRLLQHSSDCCLYRSLWWKLIPYISAYHGSCTFRLLTWEEWKDKKQVSKNSWKLIRLIL